MSTSRDPDQGSGCRIRPAVLEDAAQIAALSAELGYPSSDEDIRQRLAALLAVPSQFIAVASAAGRLLGWIAAERRMSLESGEWVEIAGLVVGAPRRRAGLGKQLVAAAERWAGEQGIATVRVRSNATREESHLFYQALGYSRQKTQHCYVKRLAD